MDYPYDVAANKLVNTVAYTGVEGTLNRLNNTEAMSKAGFYKVQLIDSNDSIVWEVK